MFLHCQSIGKFFLFLLSLCCIAYLVYAIRYTLWTFQRIFRHLKNTFIWKKVNLKGVQHPISAAQWAKDGSMLVTHDDQGAINYWDLHTGRSLHPKNSYLGAHKTLLTDGNARGMVSALDTTAHYIALAHEKDGVYIQHMPSGTIIRHLTGQTHSISTMAWSNDGHYLCYGSYDGTTQLWDMASPEPLHTFNDIYDQFFMSRILPDASADIVSVDIHARKGLVATGSILGTVSLWDIHTGKQQERWTHHHHAIRAIWFDSQGSLLASACKGGFIRIWDCATGNCIHAIQHSDSIEKLVISPCNEYVIAADSKGTISFWNIKTGQLNHTINAHNDRIQALAINHDGTKLFSAAKDGSSNIWNLKKEMY